MFCSPSQLNLKNKAGSQLTEQMSHRQGNLSFPPCDFGFVLLARTAVWILFNDLKALLFSLFYVTRRFDRFSHGG